MVSIVIPSYNSEKTIARCITALKTQTYPGDYEIFVMDSSEDSTPHIVTSRFPKVKYHHFEKKTDPGTARNLGVRQSTGDPVLFIDSDCEAAPDWIEQMVQIHRTTNYAAVGGAVMNGNSHDSNVAWAGYMAEFREFLPDYAPREIDHIPTCNISYKRRFLENLGGFNPDYYPQEDLDFNYRLIKSGQKIFFSPNIKVYHHHRTELSSFFSHQRRVGEITSRMLKILPLSGSALVRNRAAAALSIPILPAVKWLKTLLIFAHRQPGLLMRHPLAVLIFSAGLFPWAWGFYKGVYK